MKSMLGHISIADHTVINPVPIYCLSYSNNDEMIFTGDNNGLIKIWSTQTGQLIDIFKIHEKAVNDILLVEQYLISCSEDQSVGIWDTKSLQIKKMFNFDESIVRVVEYDYSANNEIHHIIIISSLSGKIYFFDLDVEIKNNFSYIEDSFPTKFYFDKKIIEKYELKKTKSMQQTSTVCNSKSGLLVCGYSDGIMCVWNMEEILDDSILKRKFIHEFDKYVLFLDYVHSSVIHLSEFSSNHEHFITGSMDGNVLVWTVKMQTIAYIRQMHRLNKPLKFFEFPIICESKISESEERTRCSVNVVIWTKSSNYVVAIISSKQRKRLIENKNKQSGNNNINNNANNTIQNNPANPSNEGVHSAKRSSAIIVYSLQNKKIIKKYNENNQFSCHDECFVLESHPMYEEIILTISGTNHIVLFNFISGQIIKQFTETNYFFTNISQNIIASEGKFSSKGDSFVISTFLGFISIYSIYSKNSFSTTYMNQFISNEFSSNTNYSIKSTIPLSFLFPQNVNMYNLPYIVEAPYSQFKINQINSMRMIIRGKYNLSDKEINQRYLRNNYEHYLKNYYDRLIECQKEEKAFEQSEQDNMNYRISEENELDNISEDENEVQSVDDLSYQNDGDVINNPEDNDNYYANLEEEEELSEDDKMVIEDNRDDISNNSSGGNYNLRSRNQNTSSQVQNTNQNNRRNEGIHTRSYDRNRNGITTRRLSNSIQVGRGNTHHRLRRRLRLRRLQPSNNSNNSVNNNIENDTNTNNNININDEINETNSDIEYQNALNTLGKKKRDHRILDDSLENKSEINSSNNSSPGKITKEEAIKELLSKISVDLIERECYFCKFTSKKLLGPFYLSSSNTISYKATNSPGEIEIYIDLNCLLSNNDFIQMNNKKLDIIKTIEEVMIQNKKCFRCGSGYATKKCMNNNCINYFHGNYCLMKMAIDYDIAKPKNEILFIECLECFKKSYIVEVDESHLKKIVINMNDIPKNLFLGEKNQISGYFPQKGENVYFILQAYEVYMRHYIEYIIFELDQETPVFFWKKEENNKWYSPFLCKVVDLNYEFLNPKTLCYLQKLYGNTFIHEKVKIIIRMKLKILDFDNEIIEIIFFENEQPDFLIREMVYLKSKKYFESRKNDQVQIMLDNEIYNAEIIKSQPKENNINFKDSLYESLTIKFLNENNNGKEPSVENDEIMLVSYWDLYIPDFKVENIMLKSLQDSFYKQFSRIIENNTECVSVFLNCVDEIRDHADNYYNIVPVPMYLELIGERLQNYYYITIESLKFDIELILKNAKLYNKETSIIVKYGTILVNKLLDLVEQEEKLLIINNNSSLLNGEDPIIIKNNTSQEKMLMKKKKRIEKELGLEGINLDDDNLLNQRNLRKRNIIQNNFEILEKPSKLNNSVNSSKKKGKRGRKKKIISNQNTNGTNIKPLNQKFDINENNNNKSDDNDY